MSLQNGGFVFNSGTYVFIAEKNTLMSTLMNAFHLDRFQNGVLLNRMITKSKLKTVLKNGNYNTSEFMNTFSIVL